MSTKKLTRSEIIKEAIQTVDILFKVTIGQRQLYQYMSYEELQDMKQECLLMILSKTVDKFDPLRKIKPATFFTPRIMGFFKDYINNIRKEHSTTKELMDNTLSLITQNAFLQTASGQKIDIQVLDDADLEAFESLGHIDESQAYILISYFLLGIPVEELASDLAFTPGRIYQMKTQGAKTVNKIIKRDK